MKSAGSSKKLIEDEVKEISKSQIRQSNSKSRTKLIQESTLVERVANKKGKKLELPEKYRQLVEDIGNDRCELADFGGAELGDQAVLQLCELFVNCRKLRVLKLFKNRINDDIFGELIYACRNINAVNLGQNNLTDKTL